MEPLYIDSITSKSRGRVTLNFNRGMRVYLKMNRSTVPHKVPIIFIAVSDGVQYAGGVNALELFQESIKFKQSSSIAREHSKLTSSSAHDGALIMYKLRITVEKVPIIRDKMAPDVNCRATDIYRRNEQYRQIYNDLTVQVSFLQSKFDQMKATKKNQTQVKFQRKAVDTQYSTYRPKASFENRSRPPIEFQFEDEQKPNKKRRRSDSGSVIGFSDSNSNKFSSQASFEVISDSDNRRNKRKRKNKHVSSGSSIEEYPIDESFSNSSGIQDVSADDVDNDGSFGNSIDSIDDVVDLDDDADNENGNNSGSNDDIIEDVVEDLDSDSDSKKKKKKDKKKKVKKSDSFESIGSFNDEDDDLNSIKLSENKKSSKGSSGSKKILSESSGSKILLSESSSSNTKKLLSETSESKKRSSDSRSKKNSSDSKSKKKSTSSGGTLSDFKSNDDSPAHKSPDFDSFSSESDTKKEDKKSDSTQKSEPSDPFASDGSF